ncbi:MAG: cysteine--tRNA ligase [Clostridium sp.]|nr:cysteine--tRNA ligase [Clostridium sp.]MCM1444061.1 cysteine--tRNA ligase [Candidatus Amulumruptor caecigallinarius]
MELYNTLTRKIEHFIPMDNKSIKMYTCGPTVYHYAHIGNLRSYIMEDVLEKTFNYIGYKVKRCMNITDVGHLTSDADTGEDKMLKGAQREHKTIQEIADMYTNAFFEDCDKLNIKKPDIVVRATSCIDTYINMIEKLLEKDFAYISDGNVYFDTSRLEEYYKLTNNNKEEMLVGVRESVTEDKNKKNKNDFVLWFTKSKFEDQALKWDSPWGIGYPGWHIECSNIAIKYLGEYLDIHCGGVDNIFPHHTNEIAQSESYIGHKWCNYWFHVEHLNDDTGKMSKSKGEFLTVSLLEEKGYNPICYRLFCLQSHYRKPLLFSYDILDGTVNIYNKLKQKIKNIFDNKFGEVDEEKAKIYQQKFKDALEDDLNTSFALTILYDVVKSDLNNNTKLYLIDDFDKILSLDLLKNEEIIIDNDLKKYIEEQIEKRNAAKKEKNFELCDQIRDELLNRGIILKDTREGTHYEIKNEKNTIF